MSPHFVPTAEMWSGMGPGLERLKNRALFKTKKPSAKTLTDSKNNRRLPKEPLSGARLALWIKHRIEPDGGTGELLSSRNWPKIHISSQFRETESEKKRLGNLGRTRETWPPRESFPQLTPGKVAQRNSYYLQYTTSQIICQGVANWYFISDKFEPLSPTTVQPPKQPAES